MPAALPASTGPAGHQLRYRQWSLTLLGARIMEREGAEGPGRAIGEVRAVLCWAMLCCDALCCAMVRCAVPWCAVLRHV